MGKVFLLHPELETGPPEFDASADVEEWLHRCQKKGTVSGQVIYDYLVKKGVIRSCLNLRHAGAIYKKGGKFFRALFGNHRVFFWAAAVRDKNGALHVPFLFSQEGDDMTLAWRSLKDTWREYHCALRFKKKKK
jgi:hypothetical protein